MVRILFVCTGNYYRSRYAEALFNHAAGIRGLKARAVSRGLAVDLVEGDLSPITARALEFAGIDPRHTTGKRMGLAAADLAEADRVVVLDRVEHEALLRAAFPEWVERVEYWDCRDVQWEPSADCLRKIRDRVRQLVDLLDDSA